MSFKITIQLKSIFLYFFYIDFSNFYKLSKGQESPKKY